MDRAYIIKQVQDGPGARVDARIRLLRHTNGILRLNALELYEHLQKLSDPVFAFQLWSLDNLDEFNEFYLQVIRLLHNFLASVGTLVDHTRRFMEQGYSGTSFLLEYNSRIDALAADGLVSFTQNLRNFMLHRAVPASEASISSKTSSGGVTIRCSFSLDVKKLRQWDGWKAPARKFLDELKENLDLFDLVLRYEEAIEDLYRWLANELEWRHRAELDELKLLLEDLQRTEN